MAKSPRSAVPPASAPESQEEMTVIVLRIKGGGDTLQKGFDALSTAFASLGQTSPAPRNERRLASGGSKRLPTPVDIEDSEDDDDTDDIDLPDAPVIEALPGQASSAPKRQPRKYKFMDDLDLNQGDKPWKDFASEKGGKNDNEHYLTAALWLTEKANIPEFGIAHVFTCFRAMGWSEQSDFSQPMRLMKSKKSYFSHPSKKLWKLTGPGLDAAHSIQAAEIK